VTFLKLTDNSKTKFRKNHYNTFGLNFGLPKNGGTCAFATSGIGGCLYMRHGKRETCYMAKIVALRKNVAKALQFNTDLVMGKSQAELEDLLSATLMEFKRKNTGKPLFFRVHYCGDFFSEDYVKAWAAVIARFPEIRFWGTTRSTKYVHLLAHLPNLTLHLSCDPVNYAEVRKLYDDGLSKHKNIGLCWLGDDTPTDEKWTPCPETHGKIQNQEDSGACSRCKLCIDKIDPKTGKVRNIAFKLH